MAHRNRPLAAAAAAAALLIPLAGCASTPASVSSSASCTAILHFRGQTYYGSALRTHSPYTLTGRVPKCNVFQFNHANTFAVGNIHYQRRIKTVYFSVTICLCAYDAPAHTEYPVHQYLLLLLLHRPPAQEHKHYCFVYLQLTSVSMRAITLPIGTTSFSLNNISAILPADVLGTSLSTLSVAISSTVSSCCTVSPGFLCHFKIVASIMLSPSFGITKSTIAIIILLILIFGAFSC